MTMYFTISIVFALMFARYLFFSGKVSWDIRIVSFLLVTFVWPVIVPYILGSQFLNYLVYLATPTPVDPDLEGWVIDIKDEI